MLRSLYTGVAGMRSHQTRMDVIGNNIANVNTTGFKSGRVHFTDMLYQTMRDAIAPGKSYSGLDPIQVGLGVKLGSIGTINTQGALESTERLTDFAINGNGFFVLSTVDSGGNPTTYYTRDGNFTIDEDGYLMHTGTGIKVQGWSVNPTTGDLVDTDGDSSFTNDDLQDIEILNYTPTNPDAGDLITFSVSKDGIISGLFENKNGSDPIVEKMGKLAIAAFSNVEGLYKVGENLLQPSLNSGVPVLNTGDPTDATIEAGYLELSNVDLTKEFANMIITQRGFQANSRVITTSDQMLEELLMLKR